LATFAVKTVLVFTGRVRTSGKRCHSSSLDQTSPLETSPLAGRNNSGKGCQSSSLGPTPHSSYEPPHNLIILFCYFDLRTHVSVAPWTLTPTTFRTIVLSSSRPVAPPVDRPSSGGSGAWRERERPFIASNMKAQNRQVSPEGARGAGDVVTPTTFTIRPTRSISDLTFALTAVPFWGGISR